MGPFSPGLHYLLSLRELMKNEILHFHWFTWDFSYFHCSRNYTIIEIVEFTWNFAVFTFSLLGKSYNDRYLRVHCPFMNVTRYRYTMSLCSMVFSCASRVCWFSLANVIIRYRPLTHEPKIKFCDETRSVRIMWAWTLHIHYSWKKLHNRTGGILNLMSVSFFYLSMNIHESAWLTCNVNRGICAQVFNNF